MLKINAEKLIKTSVIGDICPPYTMGPSLDIIDFQGKQHLANGIGGVVYNVKTGDSVYGWDGVDHLEPGVSLRSKEKEIQLSLNVLSCIGNRAVIVSAALDNDELKLKGKKGIVTGNHAGINDIHVYFEDDIVRHLLVGDKIAVFSYGIGLKLVDYPDIKVQKIDPDLFVSLGIEERDGGLTIPVTHIIPPELMGSGIGTGHTNFGDYDVQTTSHDGEIRDEFRDLRFGDIVALMDQNCKQGFGYNKGSVSIGVIIHGDSRIAGHGPGVTPILSGTRDNIKLRIDKGSNIKNHFNKLFEL